MHIFADSITSKI